jgi:hypothetical protein
MHLRIATPRLGLIALTAVAVLSILATGADAGNGHGRRKWKHRRSYDGVRYEQRWREPRAVVVSRPVRVVHAAPVYAACPPRYVSYRSPRVVVVRPAPYVRVGARIGSVHIGAIFGGRRHADYDYGCNFCDARFNAFSAYDSHVHGCAHRPRNVRIEARVWDDAGYGEWEHRDPCAQDRTYAREAGVYDEGWDDRGYDDGGYDDRDRDYGYDDEDDR